MEVLTSLLLRSFFGGISEGLAGVDVAAGASEALRLLKTAKKKHEEQQANLDTPLEVQRQELISRVHELQYEAVLTLGDTELLAKIVPLLLDLAIQIYEGTTTTQLRLLDLTLQQVSATLDNHRKNIKRHAIARRLAVIATILALGALALLAYWGTLPGGPTSRTTIAILEIPLTVLVWSAVGSFVSMLYRFNTASEKELGDPVRWLFTRPIVGVAMGTISYFIVKVGLLSVNAAEGVKVGTLEIMWLLAFLTGFSDRLAESLLRSLVGRFGGDGAQSLLLGNKDGLPLGTHIADGISLVSNWTNQLADRFKKPLDKDTSTTQIELRKDGSRDAESTKGAAPPRKDNVVDVDSVANTVHNQIGGADD
jgi:hypothetical protein